MTEQLERLKNALGDRYSIERELGRGGMAVVYLAHDQKLNREVALKVLRPELAASLGAERFLREIEIAAKLTHPNILALYDCGEADDQLYYTMPFVEGESLRQRLRQEGRLPISEALRIMRDVVDALAYAHEHRIVHRDIKPDNVMLSGRHALVTDFGVAKAVSAAGGEKLTTVGVALGTPSYMSPEQAMGETEIDHRSDIYAVGALAYEMLAGEPPFEKKTAQATLSAHVMEAPEGITEKRPTVTPALAEIVMRCLQKDKADRWQAAEELLPLLETPVTPSGGMTPTDTRPVKPTAVSTQRRGLVIGFSAAALIAVLSVGGVMLAGGGGQSAIQQVAVLPLHDLSGSDQVFVDALHDQLITALAQSGVVGVVSRSAVMPYRGSNETTENKARALGVQAVIEGTVFRDGSRMRINVQMVDPGSLRHLWTQSYDRDVDDILAVQGEVVQAIADELEQALNALLTRED